MKLVKPLENIDLINKALQHPRVNKGVSDDFTAGQGITEAGNMLWLGVYEDEYLGLIMAHAHNTILYEVHTALLPIAWGKKAIGCTSSVFEWLINNTPCERVITAVPENNKLALMLAKKTGFTEYGYNPKSIMKEGKLIGQTMLGLNKEDFLCQQ